MKSLQKCCSWLHNATAGHHQNEIHWIPLCFNNCIQFSWTMGIVHDEKSPQKYREKESAREKSHKNLKNQSSIVWIDGQCAPEFHSNRYEYAVRFMLRTNCIATYTLVQTMKWTIKLDLRGYKWPFVYRIHCALPIHFCAVIFRIVFSVAERTLVSMPMDLASMQGSHKYHDIFIDCGLFAAFNAGQIWIFFIERWIRACVSNAAKSNKSIRYRRTNE